MSTDDTPATSRRRVAEGVQSESSDVQSESRPRHKTVPLQGNQLTFVTRDQPTDYALVDWLAPPSIPGPPVHLHHHTDEAFYVLEGTFGFQIGNDTVSQMPGGFVYVRRGSHIRSGTRG